MKHRTNMLPTLAVTLLASAGCVENPLVETNLTPRAMVKAAVDGEALQPDETGALPVDFAGTPVTVELDGRASADDDGEIIDYRWLSSSLGADGVRVVPEGESADWPDNGEGASDSTTRVTVGEGVWSISLWVTDDMGAVSAAASVTLRVGDPPDPAAAMGDLDEDAGTDDE